MQVPGAEPFLKFNPWLGRYMAKAKTTNLPKTGSKLGIEKRGG
jgi:hypothetical protein